MPIYRVRDFGAVGDGLHLESAKIQAAVDLAANKGGGTLVFAPGKYLPGTIIPRDNITMRLERGSEIIGSPNIQDYNKDDSAMAPQAQKKRHASLAQRENTEYRRPKYQDGKWQRLEGVQKGF